MKLKRWEGNPVLKPTGKGYWEAKAVTNPGAYYENGTVYLLYRASGEFDDYRIYLGLATSSDGLHFKRYSDRPVFSPSKNGFDAGAVEDPRIVKYNDKFYITYAARAFPPGPLHRGENPRYPGKTRAERENLSRSGLLVSNDLKKFKRLGPITGTEVDDRDVILFPEKINGRYVMLHRPMEWVGEKYGCKVPGIWLAYSDDLISWKDDFLLAQSMFEWEETKIGGSTPPIKTDAGYLVLYHGTDRNKVYRTGVMLLDLEDPRKILARSPYPVLEPEAPYEKEGFVNNVVFPVGNIVINGTLFVYYGGADTVCCVATAELKELLNFVLKFKK